MERATKEDAGSEREYFDRFYVEHRDKPDPMEPTYVMKALRPGARPLDYWEYTFYLVGDIRGKKVLDLGCGGGWLTRMLALKGGLVSAVDVSEQGCVSTRLKLEKHGFAIRDNLRDGCAPPAVS